MKLKIGFAGIHWGEEPPLVGSGGSGTIFVSGCNLGCSFCQNYQISQGFETEDITQRHKDAKKKKIIGRTVSPREFARICVELRDKGAENINIVTGSHAVPALIEGFNSAREAGVELPILWNSSGYDSPEALDLLKDYVDIYLPDLKTLDSEIAKLFFRKNNYPDVAAAAILKMTEMKGGVSREKVIVRHLVLPGYIDSTRKVLKWFADNIKERAMLSLMTQYTPIPNRTRPMPQRFLYAEEYETVIQWLKDFGIEDGFCQELVTGSDWLPDFTRENPFSSELSVPVWHCSTSQP